MSLVWTCYILPFIWLWWPPKDMSMYEPLEPVNVTLFGKKKRSLQIKELKMLSPWIIQVGLKSNSKCLRYRREDRHRRQAMWRQRQKQNLFSYKPRDTQSYQKLEKARKDSPLKLSEGLKAFIFFFFFFFTGNQKCFND